MTRRVRLALLLVFLGLAACDALSDATTTESVTVPPATSTSVADLTSTTTSVPATTTTTELDLSGIDLPEPVVAQLEVLIRDTEEVRELRFLAAPDVAVVTPEELEARIRDDITEQSEDIPADEALYRLLGLLDEEADFESILLDLYGEQVAGLYDGETGEIVVRAREEELSVVEQSTLVHELVHALTDQHFGFNEVYRSMVDDERLDQATAYQALIEGDATLAQVMWVQSLSRSDLADFVTESLDADTTALDQAPEFLAQAVIFPYDTGLGFTQALFQGGGWAAVNEAYTLLVDLPGSTEQVITPDDYRRDLPISVEVPTVDIVGYELERTSVWGEAGLQIMIAQILGQEVARVASDGWGGDAYHQWFDGENAAFLLVYEGDSTRDLDELRDALVDYALTAVAEEDFVWVDAEDGLLYFIVADETAVGELIRSSVGLD